MTAALCFALHHCGARSFAGGPMRNNKTHRFVVKAFPAEGARPNELARTMAPHPLIHHELPFEPEYAIYNRRLASVSLNNLTADGVYWKIRREVIMRHTGELPLEIVGPDAEALLNRVFTREIANNKVGRCSYQIACYDDGGMINDGVLVRLSTERFWYGQADGDLLSWMRAHARGLNVTVFDPQVWISQVQGPLSMKVLEAAADDGFPDRFRYFDMAEVRIAGQPVVLTRTGFSNELGWEFYLTPDVDARAIGDKILEAGRRFGLVPASAEAFRTRRIEAGLLNAGSDFDETTTPFAAGLGHMVDLNKGPFIGKDALLAADRRRRSWGFRVADGIPLLGRTLHADGRIIGRVCSSAWSPFQQCGVALVRLDSGAIAPGTALQVDCIDGTTRSGTVCETPMYDKERAIPRGKLAAIPDIPQ